MTRRESAVTRVLLRVKIVTEYLSASPGTPQRGTMVSDNGRCPTDQGADVNLREMSVRRGQLKQQAELMKSRRP